MQALRSVPTFDDAYVVSDLMLAPDPTPLCRRHFQALAELCRVIGARPAGRRAALVLAGNLFDFSQAEGASGAFEPAHSAERATRALARHREEFEVLRRFLQQRDCRLVLVLGQREVDLLMPDVQRLLIEALTGGEDLPLRRVQLALDGHGCAFHVGSARVCVQHGHEADPWNHLDTAWLLGHIDRCYLEDQWPPIWPSAGHRMQAQIQQGAALPWLRHLADEGVAVALMLADSPYRQLRSMSRAPLWIMKWSATLRRLRKLPPHARVIPPPRVEYGWTGGRTSDWTVHEHPAGTSLRQIAALPTDFLPGSRAARMERFRTRLVNTGQFDVTRMDYEHVDQAIRHDVDLVVTGHHRLPMLRPVRTGTLHANCGMWEAAVRLRPELAVDDAAFARVCETLLGGKHDALAMLEAQDGLVLPRSAVAVHAGEGRVDVDLLGHDARAGTWTKNGRAGLELPARRPA